MRICQGFIWCCHERKKLDQNLLLIGLTKSGKSTLLGILKPFKYRVHIIDGFVAGYTTIPDKNTPCIMTSNCNIGFAGFRSVHIQVPSLESRYDLDLDVKLYNKRHRVTVECMKAYEKVCQNE